MRDLARHGVESSVQLLLGVASAALFGPWFAVNLEPIPSATLKGFATQLGAALMVIGGFCNGGDSAARMVVAPLVGRDYHWCSGGRPSACYFSRHLIDTG